jgi:hypothetical protein
LGGETRIAGDAAEAIRGMIDAMLHILSKEPGEKPVKKAKGKMTPCM